MKELIVYSLDEQKKRKYNPNNYNDDIDCGFIYFSKEVIKELKNHFLIFCYYMIDENETHYLIDDLTDKIMLFEGEYNRIKSVINNDLLEYNIEVKFDNHLPISDFMLRKEFLADWYAHEKSGYFYKLALNILEKKDLKNKTQKCVLKPNNYIEFCDSVRDLVCVTDFPYQELDLIKDFQEIIRSAIENIFIEFSAEDICVYFEQICKVVLNYLKGEWNNG